jgi:hypothetical protein
MGLCFVKMAKWKLVVLHSTLQIWNGDNTG